MRSSSSPINNGLLQNNRNHYSTRRLRILHACHIADTVSPLSALHSLAHGMDKHKRCQTRHHTCTLLTRQTYCTCLSCVGPGSNNPISSLPRPASLHSLRSRREKRYVELCWVVNDETFIERDVRYIGSRLAQSRHSRFCCSDM